MKNIPRSSLNSSEGLKNAIKGLKNTHKDFVKTEESVIRDAINTYDALCAPNCNLEQLTPIWKDTDSCKISGSIYKKKGLAYSLYTSKRRFVLNRWEEIKSQNGGKQLLCPICEVSIAKEMDHYVPREVMPEFSTHIHNLIPLCHHCNHQKLDKWLINGNRVCFNAYFDKPPSKLFTCYIQIELGYPMITISKDASLSDPILINTINELGLLSTYQCNLERRLKEIIEYTKNHYFPQYCTADIYMKLTYEGYKKDILSEYTSYIDKMLYTAIVDSRDYYVWTITQLNGTNISD